MLSWVICCIRLGCVQFAFLTLFCLEINSYFDSAHQTIKGPDAYTNEL